MKTLSQIFADTKIAEFGPLKIIKSEGQTWQGASVAINEKDLVLRPEQKKILAALIGQPDHKLIVGDYTAVMEKPGAPREEIDRLMKTHISLIKSALRRQVGDQYADMISSIDLTRTAAQNDMAQRGYYLRDIFKASGNPDILEWEGFKLSKSPEEGWGNACFYANGKEVSLQSLSKEFLALLIQSPDHMLTVKQVQEFYKERGREVSLESADASLKRGVNKARVQISEIAGEEAGSHITTIGLPGMSGLKLHDRGYYLKTEGTPPPYLYIPDHKY